MNGFFRAKVIDNNDPEQMGRIKVEVYPFMVGKETADTLTNTEGIDIDVMPWAVPAYPLFDGAGDGFGFFAVPKEGSFVFVFFENEDIYQPVYFASAADGVHGLPEERKTNYPDNKVWKTSSGTTINIDDSEENKEVKVVHPTGTSIIIDNDGNIIAQSVNNVTITVIGNTVIHSDGNVNITSGGNINLN